jgi:hypothetical protein
VCDRTPVNLSLCIAGAYVMYGFKILNPYCMVRHTP